MHQAAKNYRFTRIAILRVLIVATLFGVVAWLSITFTRDGGRIAAFWLPNAILLSALLRIQDHRTKAALFPACFLANVSANLFVGDSLSKSMLLASANSAEVLIMAVLLGKISGVRWKPSSIRHLATFFVSAILAASISGTFAAIILSAQGDFLAIWWSWASSDALGLLIFTPCVLTFVDNWKAQRDRAVTSRHVFLGIFVATATSLVFLQSNYPFLFLISPIVIFAAFQARTVGTALAVVIISAVASIATASGNGPIMLGEGNFRDKVIALQLFLAANLFMGLPVAIKLRQSDRAKEDLAEKTDFRNTILDNVHDIVFRTDASGRWTYLNPAWQRLTGFSVAESLGWSTTRLLHAEDRAHAAALYPKIASGEVDRTIMNQRYRDARGEERFIEVNVSRLTDERGKFLGTTGYIRDVTKQRRAERALKESERRFQTLANLAPAGIFQTNVLGECTYVNAAWEQMSGLTKDEATGDGWARSVHPADVDDVALAWRATVEKRADFSWEFRWVHRDGDVRWVHATSTPELDEDGKHIGFIGVLIDITHHKRLENELATERDRTAIVAEAKSNFLANMSHEIRTPMNGVLGFTELLSDSGLNPEQKKYVDSISESGTAMMALLNDILDNSKIEAGRITINEESVDLLDCLRNTVTMLEPVASQNRLRVDFVHDDRLPALVTLDALRLRQIVLNLLGNAIKFTEQGKISVSTSLVELSGERFIEIGVSDTGIGIKTEMLEEIFTQFTQASDDTAHLYGGSGLGLAISAQLARLMGGDLSVESEYGQGSTFRLVLPLKATSKNELATPKSGKTARSDGNRKQVRILVAEDHELNQNLMLALSERCGFEAEIARNGLEAVEMALAAAEKDSPYDLILMDMRMPVVDGLDAARRIRSAGIEEGTLPIVALTANAFADDRAACLAAGMQAHYSKPLSLDTMEDIVATWCSQIDEKPVYDFLTDDLVNLFEQHQNALCELLKETMEIDEISNIRYETLCRKLHDYAGTAANFGKAAAGNLAMELEERLRVENPGQRLAVIKAAVPAILKAA
ncbi:PAS domain S-box protein [Sphingomicrobium clamense]|uniref:histidine kinase n=1 Tax=Sphingomicrobium clamense TaxID=2851013 RepID=A0ABS6V9E2_9SPHN|nr:PAS domain S-box protein [Sphingomicrobium sp. B8]MBW0145688.1 PAS domain S-box protein [Sphingomicrobium sp. B8]